MEQLTNGDHSSSNHLFYSLQQQQQSEIFLSTSNNSSCYPTAMDMPVLDRQRSRLNALELNWQQQQHRGLDTKSEQMHGSFSNLFRSPEMFTNATITSDWQQFQSQKGPLMSANVIGAENTNILSDGSALRDMICQSLQSAVPPQQQHRLANVPNLGNGWPDLSSNEDNNNVRMIKVDGNAGSSVPSTAPACFAPFSSDPGFAERAATFSSFNNASARVTNCQRVATEESAPKPVGSIDSEAVNTSCRTTSRTAQLEDCTVDVQKFSNFTEDSVLSEKKSVGDAKFANENVVKKRKTDRSHGANLQNIKGTASEETKEKQSTVVDLGKEKEDSKAKGERSNSDNTVESSPMAVKENSKVSETPKQDYIHVRARRGQATDSHSLAERVRREKISERMKYLQDLVPGCNKITGKAVMLDEIINYVQSLQRQVEFLSMKLATVNPRLDFNSDNFLAKEVMPPCGNSPPIEVCPDLTHSTYLHFQQLQQASLKTAACCELDMPSSVVVSTAETSSLHRASAPVSAELFVDTDFQGHGPWDAGLQNAFDVVPGRQSPFASQGLPGHLEVNPTKMEI